MSAKPRNILRYRNLALACLFISTSLCFVSSLLQFPPISNVLTIVGVVFLMIFVIISFIFWRCPRCKKRLPMRFNAKNNVDEVLCPYCNMNFLHDDK